MSQLCSSSVAPISNLQAPIDRAQLSNGPSYRNNFCERQALVDNGTIALTDALKGMNITVHLMDWKLSQTIRYDENGVFDDYDPGLFVNIMDYLAKRAQFNWRDSFGVGLTPSMDLNNPNAKFSDVLNWGIETYDVSIGEWRNSRARKEAGVFFPLGFVDASLIMVQKATRRKFSPFVFLNVFSWSVWGMIIATYFVSAILYRFIHKYGSGEDMSNSGARGINFYSTFMYINQQNELVPKSNAGRIFTFSISFFSMLLIATYTANLVSFLVLGQTNVFIGSYQEAEANGSRVCVWKDTSAHNYIRKHYPNTVFVEADTKDEMYDLLNDGKCDVVSDTVWSWDSYQRDKRYNTNCDLLQVGQRAEVRQLAGLATKGDTATCSNLLFNVLCIHLTYMNEEKITEKELDRYLNHINTADTCSDADPEEIAGTVSLDYKNVAGLFIFHGICITFALAIAVCDHIKRNKKNAQNKNTTTEEAIKSSLPCHKLSKHQLSQTMSRDEMLIEMDNFKVEFFKEYENRIHRLSSSNNLSLTSRSSSKIEKFSDNYTC